MENRKLQLADICMYLPYRVKVCVSEQFNTEDGTLKGEVICDICDIGFGSHNAGVYSQKHGNGVAHISNCKPVLRPMYDLTKPMTHPDVNGGEEFVVIDILNKMCEWIGYSPLTEVGGFDVEHIGIQVFHGADGCNDLVIRDLVPMYKILNQLHFDYNDLIGQGLAIDINTTSL